MDNTSISTPPNSNNNNNNKKESLLTYLLTNLDTTFTAKTNKQLLTELKGVLNSQNINQQTWLMDAIIEYVRENKPNDTGTTLDNFVENPDFVPTPEYYGPFHLWKQHLKGLDHDKMRDFDARLEQLLALSKERWQYL